MKKLNRYISRRWSAECGYREILVLALPLVICTGSWSVQQFIDRMFLTWYSPEAIAASVPSGILNFTLICLFMGTATYVGTFVSQYFGAERYSMTGPSLWQGIYIAAFSAVLVMLSIPLAPYIFDFIGHEQAIREQEILYFQILAVGTFPVVASSALSSFYSSIGKVWIVMWVNILITGANILMNYVLIFGHLGFEPMGIAGAGISTVISSLLNIIIYYTIFLSGEYRRKYNTAGGWRFNYELFSRLIKYGLPSGIQFFLEVSGFSLFLILIGKLGTVNLAATNIAYNISNLSFMPMIGLGMAISILVGRNIGRNRADIAEYAAYSGFHIAFFYMSVVALLFVFVPELFIIPFSLNTEGAVFGEIFDLTLILMRFVAFYCIFDTMNVIFGSAVKGAGDTRFVMYVMTLTSLGVLVLPSYLIISVFGLGLMAAWLSASLYIAIVGVIFLLRFRHGAWKSMRVVEHLT